MTAEVAGSVDEWEVKVAEGQVTGVEEAETDRDLEAWGQDQGADQAYDNIAS